MIHWFLLSLVFGCTGVVEGTDADVDGWTAEDGDCDDADAAVNPDAAEACNGIDDNCDGATDESGATGETTWYADADADTYGDATVAVAACDAPIGFIADALDCDDADATVNPSATDACNGVDDNCDGATDEAGATGETTWYADADADTYGDGTVALTACDAPIGFIADALDCDDADATVNPSATEACNGIDDNCDGATDEAGATGETTWYADADADTYGDGTVALTACDAPVGFTTGALDCDDADATVNPSATEACNGIDDNCDGATDESGATGETTWYADTDADTYGDATVAVTACDAPVGYTADVLDCDDADAAVNPAMTEECNGTDDNCDGATDESGAAGEASWYADTDADGYGDATVAVTACDAPVGYAADALDCDDADTTVNPSATEACNGADDNCDGATDEAGATGETTWYADVDADTYGDATVAVTACDAPADYVLDTLDCDDTSATVNPAGTEACNGVDDDCDGTVDEAGAVGEASWYADADADTYGDAEAAMTACDVPIGYLGDALDCDDANAAVNPGMTEECNEIDDNCDGATDESGAAGEASWYTDVDADTYGDATVAVTACDAPVGYITDALDCDDANASVNPSAAEACNGVDDNCDGATDEAGATGETTWYADADADAYGDATVALTACDAPAGYILDTLDCDDTSGTVNPAGTEACNGVDDDCDGTVDEAGAAGETTWYADADADSYGDATVSETACNAPVGYLADALDCDDANATVNPSATEACNGVDDDCDGVDEETIACRPLGTYDLATYSAKLLGQERFGDYWPTAIDGDVNGDGYDDILVGARTNDAAAESAGAAYLVYGALAGVVSLGSADVTWLGESRRDWAGRAVAFAGDQNHDGYTDVLVGAQGDDDFDSDAGAAYLLFGGPSVASGSMAAADAKLTGASYGEEAGYAVAGAGDVNDDGYDDLLIGAPSYGYNNGASHLLYGPVTADLNLGSADATFRGESTGDESGGTVAAGGDVDGDGYDDLLIGAESDDDGGGDAGAAYLVYGPSGGGTVGLAAADAKLVGETTGDGASDLGLASADLDNDGYSDLLIGAMSNDGTGGLACGAVYVVRGPVSGTVDLSLADAKVSGDDAGHSMGIVSSAGDIDGDGNVDVLIGAGPANSAYLLYGPIAASLNVADADVTFLGEDAGDYAGSGVAGNGDVDGDGRPDILIAAPRDNEAGTEYGAAYLFYASDL